MNAAQLQNTTHLEPIIVYTWPSGYNRQLASGLVRRYYFYVYMYELGFGRFGQLSNKVYNMWRRVLSSIAKTAVCLCVCVCVCVSMALVQWYYIMDQQSAHTLTDYVYIQMSK